MSTWTSEVAREVGDCIDLFVAFVLESLCKLCNDERRVPEKPMLHVSQNLQVSGSVHCISNHFEQAHALLQLPGCAACYCSSVQAMFIRSVARIGCPKQRSAAAAPGLNAVSSAYCRATTIYSCPISYAPPRPLPIHGSQQRLHGTACSPGEAPGAAV